MPYMIRPREDRRRSDMRDGKGHDKPMRWICADWFMWYDNLPNGVDKEGTPYFQVIEVASREEAESKANALGIPLRVDVIGDEEKPKPVPAPKSPEKPVKVSEYLRDKARDKIPTVESAIEDIEAGIDAKPSGASFGSRGKEDTEEEQQQPDAKIEEPPKKRGRPSAKKR